MKLGKKNYPLKIIDDWKRFEKYNKKKNKKLSAYISNHNSTCQKTKIVWMIPQKRRLSFLTLKKLSILLRRKASKHHGDFYCLNFLYSFSADNKLKSHEKVCKNKDFFGIVMPTEKILKFNQ